MTNCNTSPALILQLALPVPLDRCFDYFPPEGIDCAQLQPGMRLLVPFGKSQKVGVLLGMSAHSDHATERLKAALVLMDTQPLLSSTDLDLLRWASQYYHHPIGEVVATALPTALRQGQPAVRQLAWVYQKTAIGQQLERAQFLRAPKQQALWDALSQQASLSADAIKPLQTAAKAWLAKGWLEKRVADSAVAEPVLRQAPLPANAEQQAAIDAIVGSMGRFSVSLLEGVTGSGKTEVYMQAMAAVLAQGRQVLVLLPEITLTPQLEQRFRQRFATPIVCFHSKLSDSARLQAWLALQQGAASIMLGTRSSLFTPMPRPGLLILDEEHDSSFKQQEGFRFSARDVAIARAQRLGIPVVLGSATPSFESLQNVERQRFRLLALPARAGNATAPLIQLLDIRNKPLQGGLSEALLSAMRHCLAQGEQVLLFLNRRGYAPVQICHGCGWVSRCQRCDANLVIHAAEALLRCHHCGCEQALRQRCPSCQQGELQALGLGTERIEQTLTQQFSGKQVLRLDRDTTQRKGQLEGYLAQIHAGQADIILGTQMLAKGHHFPGVTLVAIVDIDSGLFSIDYRSGEKLAQLIVQVAGRAGRADKAGRVLLQTRQPHHPLLNTLLTQGYRAFANAALLERHQAGLPPHSFQALMRVQSPKPEAAQAFLDAAVAVLTAAALTEVAILGPVTAPMARRAGLYRYQLLLQSRQRQVLHHLLSLTLPAIHALKQAKRVRWSLDVDPQDLY